MSASERDMLWVLVCGQRIGPIHPFHFPALMSLQRITPNVRSGEHGVYISDPKHLAEVVDMALATARAEGETAGYARGRRDAFSEAAEIADTYIGRHDTALSRVLRAKVDDNAEAPHE